MDSSVFREIQLYLKTLNCSACNVLLALRLITDCRLWLWQGALVVSLVLPQSNVPPDHLSKSHHCGSVGLYWLCFRTHI